MHALSRTINGLTQTVWVRRLTIVVLGAAAGFAYYYFVGCATGTCTISSNPYISTLYGAMMAFLVSGSKKKVRSSD